MQEKIGIIRSCYSDRRYMTGWLVASCRGGDIIGYWRQCQVFRHDDYQNVLWRSLTRQMTKFSWAFWQDLIRISGALSIEIKQYMHVTVLPPYCFEYWLVKYHPFVIRRRLFVFNMTTPPAIHLPAAMVRQHQAHLSNSSWHACSWQAHLIRFQHVTIWD